MKKLLYFLSFCLTAQSPCFADDGLGSELKEAHETSRVSKRGKSLLPDSAEKGGKASVSGEGFEGLSFIEVTPGSPEFKGIGRVYRGVAESNREYMDPVDEKCIVATSIGVDQPSRHLIGMVEQYNITLSLEGLGDLSPDQEGLYGRMVRDTLRKVRVEDNIQKAWVCASSQTRVFLEGLGFEQQYTFQDLDTGEKVAQFYLDLTKVSLDVEGAESAELPLINISWILEDEGGSESGSVSSSTSDNEGEKRSFGLLVKDGSEKIIGGIHGIVDLSAAVPHCWILKIWVDPLQRGKKLGGRLLDLAEDYAREVGAHVMELGTSDFQAPWLYKKRGYIPYRVRENFKCLRDGTFSNRAEYRKPLQSGIE